MPDELQEVTVSAMPPNQLQPLVTPQPAPHHVRARYAPAPHAPARRVSEPPPLSPTALEILDRYKDQPDGRLLPFICEQDYNRDIDEEMAKEVILKLE